MRRLRTRAGREEGGQGGRRRERACEGCVHVLDESEVRPGDWLCYECNTVVFASKHRCYKCKALRYGAEPMIRFPVHTYKQGERGTGAARRARSWTTDTVADASSVTLRSDLVV